MTYHDTSPTRTKALAPLSRTVYLRLWMTMGFLLATIANAQSVNNEPARYLHGIGVTSLPGAARPAPNQNLSQADLDKLEALMARKTGTGADDAGKAISATLSVGPTCTYASLQLAVSAASSGDVIRVRGITFSGANATVNITNKSLIINGGYGIGCNALSSTRTTLNAAGEGDSVFEFTDTIGGMTAAISNFIISNGEEDFDYGGGIEFSGSNTARLFALISNVSISNNQSTRGAGMHITDSDIQLLAGSKIYSNTATLDGTNTGNGGGIYCLNSSVEVVDSDIGYAYGNSAQNSGGGVYLDSCRITLNAISGTAISAVRTNSATESGGGVYATNNSRINLKGDLATISGNNAKFGGGVSLRSGSDLFGDKGMINSNTASLSGGGFYMDGASSIFDMDQYSSYPCGGKCNQLSNNTAQNGGAGYIIDGQVRIDSAWIEGNSASSENLAFSNSSSLSIKSSMLLHNLGTSIASRLITTYGANASTTIELSTIADTQRANNNAAKLFVVSANDLATLNLDSNVIWENGTNYGLFSKDGNQLVTIENNVMEYAEGGTNLTADPLFLVPGSNYHISPSSPATDYANIALQTGGAIDIDAESINLGAAPDAGADEAYLRVGVAASGCAYTSITEAIAAASTGDTIYISPGNYVENPGLIDKDLDFVPATPFCDAEKSDANSLTVIIDGGDLFRTQGGLFEIGNGVAVSFKNMSLKNARADRGGVLYVTGNSSLLLDNVDVSGGVAQDLGGGIHSNGFSRLINASRVYANSAQIIVGPPAKVEAPAAGSAENGGGISLSSTGTLVLEDGSMIGFEGLGNSAANNGGGIYNSGGQITLSSGSSVIANSANSGAGVYMQSGVLSMGDQTTIGGPLAAQGNVANINGGGISTSNAAVINMQSTSYVRGNSASSGGGVHILSNGQNTIINGGNIYANDASNQGGGLYVRTTTSASNVQLSAVKVENNQAADGGGVYYNATNSGGNFVLTSTGINNNISLASGGGLHFTGTGPAAAFRAHASAISGNSAAASGGGIMFSNDSDFITTGGVIINNNSAGTSGGGIYMLQGGDVSLDGGSLANNQATNDGGGIYTAMGNGVLRLTSNSNINMNINNNTATTGRGGAVYHNGSLLEIGRNTGGTGYTRFSSNSSGNEGGAIYAANTTIEAIGDLNFSNNTAGLSGGAIYGFDTGGRIAAYNNVRPQFTGNSAQAGNGGGLSLVAALGNNISVQLLGVDFGSQADPNSVAQNGGAIYLKNIAQAALINLNVSYNNASGSGGGVFLDAGETFIDAYMPNAGYPASTGGIGYATACDPSQLGSNQFCSNFAFNTIGDNNGAAIDASGAANLHLSHTAITDHSRNPISIYGGATFDFSHSLLARNGGGSALLIAGTGISFDLSFLTLAANSSTQTIIQNGGSGNSGAINRSLFWANNGGISTDIPFAGTCNNTEDASLPGTSVDPLFETTALGDFRLAQGSPAIDICQNGTGFDLEDKPRSTDGDGTLTSNERDIGAFETPYTGISLNIVKTGTGNGTVTSSPAGIDCGGTCNAGFPDATTITLSATPAAGHNFAGWTGACTASGNTCTLTINQATEIQARFDDPEIMFVDGFE